MNGPVNDPADGPVDDLVDGPVRARTIPELLDECAHRWRGRIAVLEDGHGTTYEQLHADVMAAADGLLRQGICAGDRVGLWAPNSYRWVVASFALHCIGAVVVPLNTRYRSPEAWDYLVRAGARALLVADRFLGYEHLRSLDREAGADAAQLELVVDLGGAGGSKFGSRPVLAWGDLLAGGRAAPSAELRQRMAAVRPEDLSDIIFTSGTTGRSKGVCLTHGAPLELYLPYGEIWGLRPGDRYLIILPFFHTGGNKAGMLTCLIHGLTIVPMPVYDPELVMQVIERDRVTVMNGSPTIYTTILDDPRRSQYDLSSLRLAATGAAIVPQRLVERARTELPFENFITAYGLTECCGTATMCRAEDPIEVVAATNGSALPGVELRVVDKSGADVEAGLPGEVLVRGRNVTPGYWRDAEATATAIDAGGWLHTGDLGTLDARGNLKITDRLKDLFIVGGFNVSPAEVEQVMARHPAISEVSVVGVRDERLGEAPLAYVILKPEADATEAGIIAWCRERMANFKVPRTVVFADTLPRGASGKVLKRELRGES